MHVPSNVVARGVGVVCGVQRKEVDDLMSALPPTAGQASAHPPLRVLRSLRRAMPSSTPFAAVTEGAPSTASATYAPAHQQHTVVGVLEYEADAQVDEDSDSAFQQQAAAEVLGRLAKDWPAKVCGCLCFCICVYVCVGVYTCVCIYVSVYICMHMYVCIYMYIYVYTYIHMHVYMYAHTHIYTSIYMYTYT